MQNEDFMREALAEARKAYDIGEVPVGAVVVQDGVIVGRGHNTTETAKDPSCHAEMNAIRDAARTLGGWRLPRCTMYVTVEPCPMCSGAIVNSRLEKVVYGCPDVKAGGAESIFNIITNPNLNHRATVRSGVMKADRPAG